MVLVELVEFSKLALAVAVWCYVYFFLRKTEDYVERRPWEYLYIACMALFLFEMISFLQIFRARAYGDDFFMRIRGLLELAFLGWMLFAFLSQHRLLLHQKLIVIAEARPKLSYEEQLEEREQELEEHQDEERETKDEAREQAMFEKQMSELPRGAGDMARDEEYLGLVKRAREILAKSEMVLEQAGNADPVRVALFRDEVADLQSAIEDPSCTAQRLRAKIKSITG